MSTSALTPAADASPLSARLSALTRLDAEDLQLLRACEQQLRKAPARREWLREGKPIREQRAIVRGWACRQRILIDGRRQILGVLLPGDLFGVCERTNPVAITTVWNITEVVTCPAPDHARSPALAEAYAQSAALDEWYMLAQIARLGRLNAYERLADWLLETYDRLAMAGHSADEFRLPLTQEMLADALGLTSVHVNRTLQQMRRDGMLVLRAGCVSFPDRARLAKLVDYRRPRVSLDRERGF